MLRVDLEVRRRGLTVRAAFALHAGERLALYGPSGAGKSTILAAIAGLVPLERGTVELDGQVLSTARRSVAPHLRAVGLVRQQPTLFPHLDVWDNITAAPGAKADAAAAHALLALLGLTELSHAAPLTLSGGQRQRVALARTLLSPYRVLCLDEPFTGLEDGLRQQLLALLRTLLDERGAPSILVTHDLVEAQAFAERLGVLDAGTLLQLDTAEAVVRRPASRRVAELVGYRGFVPVGGSDGVIGIHPQRVRLGAWPQKGPVLRGRVTATRYSGGGVAMEVLVAGNVVHCQLSDAPPLGQDVTVTPLDPPFFTTSGLASKGLDEKGVCGEGVWNEGVGEEGVCGHHAPDAPSTAAPSTDFSPGPTLPPNTLPGTSSGALFLGGIFS